MSALALPWVGSANPGSLPPPRVRFVWVTQDLERVSWRALGAHAASRSLLVRDLQDVRAGQHTPVFERGKGRLSRDFASFSLVFGSGRTLDLEVRSVRCLLCVRGACEERACVSRVPVLPHVQHVQSLAPAIHCTRAHTYTH